MSGLFKRKRVPGAQKTNRVGDAKNEGGMNSLQCHVVRVHSVKAFHEDGNGHERSLASAANMCQHSQTVHEDR